MHLSFNIQNLFRPIIIVIVIVSVLPIIHCSVNLKNPATALFISVPFIGHLNPLLRQAIELYHRHGGDYHIYIISCSNVKAYIEQSCFNTTIQFLDIGQCYNVTEFESILEEIASSPNSLLNGLIIFRWAMETVYPQMYEQIIAVVQSDMFNESTNKVAIVDMLTYAGAHFAHHFDIPLIINNGDLLPTLGWFDIAPADYNPLMMLDPPQSIHSIGTNLFKRTVFPVIRLLLYMHASFRVDRLLNAIMPGNLHFNNSLHAFRHYNSHMILVNNAWGLEYTQSLPPYVQMTGPMLWKKLSPTYYITLLSDEDRQWIESDSRPIIYVNFGTCVPVSNKQIEKICEYN